MSANLGNLKRKKRPVEARKVKRRSDYMPEYTNRVDVGGPRDKTDTGYAVKGFVGKNFETYFETMLPSTQGPRLHHEKKDKVIRVLNGILNVTSTSGKLTSTNRFIPGDEVTLERGTSYQLSTAKEPTSFFVCQSAKYDATLEVLAEGMKAEVPPSLLEEPSVDDRMRKSLPHTLGTNRKGSKAKEQLRALQAARNNRPAPKTVKQSEIAAQASYGTNPKPGMGSFDKEGAG